MNQFSQVTWGRARTANHGCLLLLCLGVDWAEVTAIADVRDEEGLVEARRLVGRFESSEELTEALRRYVATDAPEAYVLYRELDYFEQLGALEEHGGLDFGLVRMMLGQRLVERWELWAPSIEAIGGADVYPMFTRLAGKMRAAAGAPR